METSTLILIILALIAVVVVIKVVTKIVKLTTKIAFIIIAAVLLFTLIAQLGPIDSITGTHSQNIDEVIKENESFPKVEESSALPGEEDSQYPPHYT